MKNFIIAAALLSLASLCGHLHATSLSMADALVQVAPEVRSSALPPSAPASISAAALRPFSMAPMLVGDASLSDAPRIVAGQERRAYFGPGDKIYVEGDLQGTSMFRLLRRGRALTDPLTGEHLGDELVQLGTARSLARAASGLHSLLIVDAAREIHVGDRLSALPAEAPSAITPQLSSTAVDALIVSVNEGAVHAAQSQIVAINKGARDDIRSGMQLSVYADARIQKESAEPIARQTGRVRQTPLFPVEESARLLIIRVFDRVSYGLITQAREPVQVGDKALAPWLENKDVD